MTRFSAFAFGLATLIVLSGCSDVLSQRSPDYRRGDARTNERRADDRAWNRLDRDARAYAQRLDNQLRLDDRQERQIRRILEERGEQLRRARNSAYPFPRQGRGATRARGFWRDVDRRIERVLDRDQKRRYREMTRQQSRNDNRDRRGRRGRG